MDGIAYIFLTHQDDVADAERYARHFKAKRIIHEADLSAQPQAEMVIQGLESFYIHPEFQIIPTPGHTRGHMVLLFRERFLFTGDHLSWWPELHSLNASRNYCWYSWQKQMESMQRIAQKNFEWVLPGHGHRIHQSQREMHHNMEVLIERMQI